MSTKIPNTDSWLHECKRCRKKWVSSNQWPETCAKCRSPYWNKPIERKTVSEARKKR